MRKRKKRGKFGRETGQRKALLKTMASALILKERIKTTEERAKILRSFIEKMITKAKKGDLAAKKTVYSHFNRNVGKKLIDEIAPSFKERKGGYTRIFKLNPRKSDSAKMALIEFIK
jgi:large subunit ribosomal protein L17